MARDFKITIDSVSEGLQSSSHQPKKGQFNTAIGFDPDSATRVAQNSPDNKPGLTINPQSMVDVSTAIDDVPIAIITSPQSNDGGQFYTVLKNGKIFLYQSVSIIGSENFIGSVAGSNADGAFYYNNYIYITGTGAGKDDIARYGPLDGTPSIEDAVWTGTTLGSQAKLGTQTYPTIGSTNSTRINNHWGHVHSDGAAYFCDYQSNKGLIHKIETGDVLDMNFGTAFTAGLTITGATSKATATVVSVSGSEVVVNNILGTFELNETITDSGTGTGTLNTLLQIGKANTGSSFGALDLPNDHKPVDIESFGTDLIIAANQVTENSTDQGGPALFLWDPTNVITFYRHVRVNEVLALTALLNKGGTIYVFGGSLRVGSMVSIYDGAEGLFNVEYFQDLVPPLQGSVDSVGNRIVWGCQDGSIDDTERAVIVAMGYRSGRMPSQALNIINILPMTNTVPYATCVKYVNQAFTNSNFTLVAGGRDLTEFKITAGQNGSSTINQVIQWGSYPIGEPFKITKIRLPLASAVQAGIGIQPSLIFDQAQSTYTLPLIDNTNYSGEKTIVYKTPELTDTVTSTQAKGEATFMLRLEFTGTIDDSVLLPITIEGETIDD